jgi:beta-glucosidase
MTRDVQQLISQMSLEEKASLCTGASPWRTIEIERLGIESMIVADGPHGLRRSKDVEAMITESFPATCFPVAAALSASWDVNLLHEVGQALAEESIALETDIILGPGMNIKRSPLCGRNFEYFSEDPLLSGEMAAALINGIQTKGVGASVKHFAVNNQETRRFTVNALVDERALHEIYLAGFEIAVKKAQPWTIMCAYNSVNGEFCAENAYLLTDILRCQWGFEGFVMSDWGAVHDRVAGIRSGLELEMPGPSPHRIQAVIDAVRAGELEETLLDQAVERLLNIILRAQATPKTHREIDVESHHSLARRVASECMVLLKNDNVTLPLIGNERLAVIGQAARAPVYQGGGSSHINSTKVDSPLDFLRERAELQYVEGDASMNLDQDAIDDAVAIAQDADVVLLFLALPPSIESEGYDRPHLNLTEQQITLIKVVGAISKKTVVILNNGSALAMNDWIDNVDAVLESWLPGQAGAGAIVDILYGDINPSGKLGETFPVKLVDTPAHLNFPGERNEVRYGEGIFVGYRGYEALNRDVLFPFGFGLSYTQFEYSNLQLSKTAFSVYDTLEVTVDITNTGDHDGKEIVQLFVQDINSTLPRPPKELKGFDKVSLAAGETKRIAFHLDDRAFSYYDPAYGQWLAEAGEFAILVGSSSADIQLSQRVQLIKGTSLPVILNEQSTLSEWMAAPQGYELVKPYLVSMFGDTESDALGIDASEFFKDLPLTVLLRFRGDTSDRFPEETVKGLLARLKTSQS